MQIINAIPASYLLSPMQFRKYFFYDLSNYPTNSLN